MMQIHFLIVDFLSFGLKSFLKSKIIWMFFSCNLLLKTTQIKAQINWDRGHPTTPQKVIKGYKRVGSKVLGVAELIIPNK